MTVKNKMTSGSTLIDEVEGIKKSNFKGGIPKTPVAEWSLRLKTLHPQDSKQFLITVYVLYETQQ